MSSFPSRRMMPRIARRSDIGVDGSMLGSTKLASNGKSWFAMPVTLLRPPSPRNRDSGDAFEPEHGMIAGDAEELGVLGVRSDALEEGAGLHFPSLQVGAEDGHLVGVRDFDRTEGLVPSAQAQAALVRRAEVTHPLGRSAGGDQV